MIEELSKSLTPRLMVLLLIAIAVLIVSTGYSAMFKQPVKQYKQQQVQVTNLRQLPANQSITDHKINRLRQEISALETQLTKTGLEVLTEATPMNVLAELGDLAQTYNVQLISVAPSDVKQGPIYSEVPFDLKVSGSYGQIFKWVYALEHAASPLFIKQFSIGAGTALDQRALEISVALVQPGVGDDH